LSKSGTVWTDIVDDAKRRNCIFSATNDAIMRKLILQVKQDLDELDDLLNANSAFFSNTRWKVSKEVLFSFISSRNMAVFSDREVNELNIFKFLAFKGETRHQTDSPADYSQHDLMQAWPDTPPAILTKPMNPN
jgi:hypothetical protein